MKRYALCLLCLLPVALLFGCAQDNAADYPAAIMAEDTIYYKADEPMPAEVDEGAILGYTDSYTDVSPRRTGRPILTGIWVCPTPRCRAAWRCYMKTNGIYVLRKNEALYGV